MTNQSEQGNQKGGQHSQSGGSEKGRDTKASGQQEQADRSSGQQQGGSGSFKNNPDKASEAGQKGGQHSHGGK